MRRHSSGLAKRPAIWAAPRHAEWLEMFTSLDRELTTSIEAHEAAWQRLENKRGLARKRLDGELAERVGYILSRMLRLLDQEEYLRYLAERGMSAVRATRFVMHFRRRVAQRRRRGAPLLMTARDERR